MRDLYIYKLFIYLIRASELNGTKVVKQPKTETYLRDCFISLFLCVACCKAHFPENLCPARAEKKLNFYHTSVFLVQAHCNSRTAYPTNLYAFVNEEAYNILFLILELNSAPERPDPYQCRAGGWGWCP